MKERVEYKFGEFVDFAGITRKFVVAAVSVPTNILYVASYDKAEQFVPSSIAKILSIGIAICCPSDTYNEEVGKKVAYSKAMNPENPYRLFASAPGMVNTKMVDALIEQEITYFTNNPESHIKGYNDAMYKYLNEQQKAIDKSKMMDGLTNADLETIHYIKGLEKEKRDSIMKLICED